MNIALWILQVLLALHTVMGAVWKLSNPAQTVPSLNAIPHGVWLTMGVIELVCALGLALPVLSRRLGILAPVAAIIIGAEMLLFCGLSLYSGEGKPGELIYWLVVALFCGFIAFGRLVLKPL